jgi:hypothetical protein
MAQARANGCKRKPGNSGEAAGERGWGINNSWVNSGNNVNLNTNDSHYTFALPI